MADNNSKLLADYLVSQGIAYSAPASGLDEAKSKLDDAKNAQLGNRRAFCLDLAKFSAKNALSEKDINAGVKAAVAAYAKNPQNDKMGDKTFKTMAGEAKRAMHPKVRDGYEGLMKTAEALFREAKAATEVVRDAYKRPEFLVNAIASAVATTKLDALPKTEARFIEIANAKLTGRREDVERCRKGIAGIKEKIDAEKRTFPVPAFDTLLKVCDALLRPGVLEKALKMSQNAGDLKRGKGKGKSLEPDASVDDALAENAA